MDKKLLNQFVDVVKKRFSSYLVYIDTMPYGDVLILKYHTFDYEFHIDTLHMENVDGMTDTVMDEVRTIYLQFRREHLLNIIL